MLVLSRKAGERIVIGDNISIVVNRVSGNRVSIGVQAPGDVKIVRGELEQFVDEFADDDRAEEEPVVVPTVQFENQTVPFLPRAAR